MPFYDRRGRFSQRRVGVGLLGIILGFLNTALFYYLFLAESPDAFIPPGKSELILKKFSVHCIVITAGNYSVNFVKQEKSSISQTWGKQCSSLFFVGDPQTNSWESWQDAIEKGNQVAIKDDWIVLTGLGSYVIVENLRKMVAPYTHTDTPSFVWSQEYRFRKEIIPHLVISQMGIEKLYKHARKDIRCISRSQNYLHILHNCLSSVGFVVADNRDQLLHHKIITKPIREFLSLIPRREDSVNALTHMVKPGVDCCSSDLVSAIALSPVDSRFYDYLLYKIVY